MLGIGAAAILARLLTPEDSGLLAMAGAFVALITNFADLGLPQATIQRADVTQDQVSALFWINTMLGLIATGAGVLVAWPVAWFFQKPELVAVTAALSLAFVVTGVAAQHQALLRR
ncbi:MAG: oligosaccharide flippase family protein, partial [Planctomycetota bacterium]